MKKVTLLPNPYRDRGFVVTCAAEDILRRAGARTAICLPFALDDQDAIPPDLHLVSVEEGLQDCHAMISFGGDGTILHAARLIGARDIPILGVNTGNMGYLAALERSELNLLPKVLSDHLTYETRLMLHVTVKRDGHVIFEDDALNDAVITKGSVARVISLVVDCDGAEAMRFDGDGVILATPTGSTAYSMAAGGPMVEPTARNMIITPLCPHTMGLCSLVLTQNRVVSVRVGRIGRRSAFLSVDGGRTVRLGTGDQVIITASQRNVRLVTIKEQSCFSVLNHKLQG